MTEPSWRRRWPPLEPTAMAVPAVGAAEVSTRTGPWTRYRAGPWLVLVGDELPWVDGATYLTGLPGAPQVLGPVHWATSVPDDLLAAALRRHAAHPTAKIAVLPSFTTPPTAASPMAIADAVDVVVLG